MSVSPKFIWIGALICCMITPLVATTYRHNSSLDVVGEFVFMRRGDIHNNSLVKDANKPQCLNQCADFTVLTTRNLVNQFDYEPGYRIGLTYLKDQRMSFEGNFMWLAPWTGEKTVHGDQSLSFPFNQASYTQDFNNASKAIALYTSDFWNAEFNFWWYFTPRRVEYFCLSMVTGLRYFHWNESFKLNMGIAPEYSTYMTHTANKIGGIQTGLDFQMNPMRWLSWDILAKVGIMANYAQANTLLKDSDNTITLHNFKDHKWECGVFADVAARFALHFTSWLSFHAGYEVLFFSGLALAPEQISKHTQPNSGKNESIHGDAIIHGLYTGLILSF